MATDVRPQALVRRYSQKVAGDVEGRKDSVATVWRILAEDVRTRQRQEQDELVARKLFETWKPPTKEGQEPLLHEKQAKELFDAWAQFRQEVPKEERASLSAQEAPFDDVRQLMEKVGKSWDQKRNKGKLGKIRGFYTRCCLCIKSHESMLKLLPEGDKYFSLFTGVLKSVVYATANHEKIAQGLSRAIAEISETVESCADRRELYNTQKMQQLNMELYAHIFIFFRDVLKWYLDKVWKRLIKSFNEDFWEFFEDQVTNIRNIAQSIEKAAWLGQAGEVRTTRLTVERLESTIEEMKNEKIRAEEALLKREEEYQARHAALVQQMLTGLEESAKGFLVCPPPTQRALRSSSAMGLREPMGSLIELNEVTRDTVLEDSKHLESFFDRARVRIRFDPATVVVPSEAMGRLQTWAAAKGSSLLCLTGPEESHSLGPSAMSTLAAKMVTFVDQSKLPVISYFCNKKPKSPAQLTSPHAQGTAALVHALLRQAFELLSPTMETSKDMSAVTELDGTLDHFDQVLDLLDTALQNGKPILYCIIDGLQDVESRDTLRYLEKLVRLLKNRASSVGGNRAKLKVLLTASGRSRCLLRNLNRSEMVLADDPDIDGLSLQGRQPLLLGKS